MAITFSCPTCGKSYKVDEQFAGKHARCKSCQADMTVPAPATSAPSPGIVDAGTSGTRRCPKCGDVIAALETVCPHCKALVAQLEEVADWVPAAAPEAPRAAYQPQEERAQSTRCPQCGTWIAPSAGSMPRCPNCNYQPGAAESSGQRLPNVQAITPPKKRAPWAGGFWSREFTTPANFAVLAAFVLLIIGEAAPATAQSLAYVCQGLGFIVTLGYAFWFAFEIRNNLEWLGPLRELPAIMIVVLLLFAGVEKVLIIGGAKPESLAHSTVLQVAACIIFIPMLISFVVGIIGVVCLFRSFLTYLLGFVRCFIIGIITLCLAPKAFTPAEIEMPGSPSHVASVDWHNAVPTQHQDLPQVIGHAPGIPAIPDSPTPPPNAPTGPIFPERPGLTVMAPGIQRAIIRMTGTGPGSQMQMYLYIPEGVYEPGSLPCVLIAPAGTNGLAGATLGPGDEPEHTPYVRAGYVVLAYELDGAVIGDPPPARERIRGLKEFRSAEAGMTNARLALEYVLAKVPEVNPHLIFAAGHSSAGAVALNFAAHDHRLRGVIAYAPTTDIPRFESPEFMASLNKMVPGAADFARDASPIAHVDDIQCPAFIFHADDDGVISDAEITPFISALKAKNANVKYTHVATGNHYDSMIKAGIPMAIAWLQPTTHATPVAETLAALNALEHAQAPTKVTPAPTPATPTPLPPAVPEAITHYTVVGPTGFKEDDNPPDHSRQWTRTRPGRSVSSTFTVTARFLTDPNVAADPPLPNDPTFIAGPLTFHLVGSSGNGVVKSVRWQAVDKTCLIEIKAAWDQFDVDAEAAMTNACKKILPAKAPAPATSP